MTAAPHPFIIRHDGRDLAGLEWGSGDDHVVLLHPNGFCAGLFDPLARRLATDHPVVAVDLAGHGCSSALPQDDSTFNRPASDRSAKPRVGTWCGSEVRCMWRLRHEKKKT